jgi:hypothetical protein
MPASTSQIPSLPWHDRLWASIAPGGRPDEETPLDRVKRLAAALLSERGEASGAIIARELLTACGLSTPRTGSPSIASSPPASGRMRIGCAQQPRPTLRTVPRRPPQGWPGRLIRPDRSCCAG